MNQEQLREQELASQRRRAAWDRKLIRLRELRAADAAANKESTKPPTENSNLIDISNHQQHMISNRNSFDTIQESKEPSRDPPKHSRRGKILSLIGGQAGYGGGDCRQPVIHELTNDFERISTIIAPTEVGGDGDFTSNVDARALKNAFFRNYKKTTNLPIYNCRSEILNSINSYSVVILQGQTGCGKTTQVPVYILEDAILDRRTSKSPVIYVTQPRRIAAKSIARRVAEEHDWNIGEVVGYQVGLDKSMNENTVLTFCTAGVLLQKLINEKSLQNYTHIVIDEAHERDADTDLLMMLIKTLMARENSFFRLIVMSATIEVSKLKSYFTFKTAFGHNSITVPSICRIQDDVKTRNHEVQIVYLDNLSENFQDDQQQLQFDYDEPDLHEDCLKIAVRIIVEDIPNLDIFNSLTQTVLVFLPGLAEITKLHRMLNATGVQLDIIPLHSTLPYSDQHRIFMPSERNLRKVILATNIAESSITVRDAGFIVDFCLTKVLKKDPVTKFPMLKIDWCTRDKLIQRAGRTGRCCPGKVFRLITSHFYRALREYAEPELLISPLELSVLKLKSFDMGDVKDLLGIVLDPPPIQEIQTAVLELKQIGAMTSHYKGKLSDEDGDLTELGHVIAKLPIDVHLSKLIVIASLLDVLEPAIIVAASLSSNRNVVKHMYDNVLESYRNRLEWAQGAQSDLFVSLNVYRDYIYHKETLQKDPKFMERYCNNKYLDERKLEEITALKTDLINRLEHQNIRILEQPNRQRNVEEDDIMLKVAFCAAFYPHYFINQEIDPKEVEKELCGFDPSKTVILGGFPVGSVPLYRTQVFGQLNQYVDKSVEYIADYSRALLRIDEDGLDPDDLVYTDEQSVFTTLGINVGNIQLDDDNLPKLRKSFCSLLRAGQQDYLTIREYKKDAADERMIYYQDARAQIVIPRLIPSMVRLVDREPDNGHLTDTTDEEFERVLKTQYYTEVQFNQAQDNTDTNYLIELFDKESRMRNWRTSYRNSKPGKSYDDDEIFGDQKNLRGPYSPIQMKFLSVLNKSRGFNVDVCPNSVNSLLLDLNYNRRTRQMLVAASVGQSQKNSRIIIRDTTLMFNVLGLPSLMSLLFARTLKLIYNEKLKSYSGAIFSLGWDDDGQPLQKEYQVELDFDVRFTQSDFAVINECRKTISTLIQFLEINNSGAPELQLKYQLRRNIMWLIKQERAPMTPIDLTLINWKSGSFVKDTPNQSETISAVKQGGRDRHLFLPPIVTTKDLPDYAMIELIRENLNWLDKLEKNEIPWRIGGAQCLLCGCGIGYLFIMKSKLIEHVWSREHEIRLKELEITEKKRIYSEAQQQQQPLQQ